METRHFAQKLQLSRCSLETFCS